MSERRGQFMHRQRHLLRDLIALAAARSSAETETEGWYTTSTRKAEQERGDATRAADQKLATDLEVEIRSHRERTERIRATAKEQYDATERTQTHEREKILEKAGHNEQEARRQLDEAVWVTDTVFEAKEPQPDQQLRTMEKTLAGRREELETIAEQAQTLLRKYRQKTPALPDDNADDRPADRTAEGEHAKRLDECSEEAAARLLELRKLRIARLFKGLFFPFLLLLIVAGAAVGAAWRAEWQLDRTVALTGAGAFASVTLVAWLLFIWAKRRTRAVYVPLAEAVRDGLAACDGCQRDAEIERDRQAAEMREQRDHDVAKAREKYEPILLEIEQRRKKHLSRIDEKYPKLLEEIVEQRERDLAEEKARHEQRVAEIRSVQEKSAARRDRDYSEAREEREVRYTSERSSLEVAWREGMERCADSVDALRAEASLLFPRWDDPSWKSWTPPMDFSPSVRFGEMAIDRRVIPGGITDDARLAVDVPVEFELPVTLDFPDHCSLLLLGDGEARDTAVATIQTVMLRLLTALPPGKVRFTIIDPVGLGESFAGFMHLADYEEAFVTSRIWTETRHIEQRLADLTEHMETVIQKYLRNEFDNIAEYNEQAGEIAEPYRFLVISDFPANFSDTAARRLASIVSSGARCGLHTLISVDRRQQLPKGVEMEDLEASATTLEYKDGAFTLKDEDFEAWPLALERPPAEEFLTRKLQLVGEASKDATRVEVPFATVAPRPEECWTRECSRVLRVPLGRSGATKLQELAIGAGTAQHALIAGKTGSGKSTLLHVVITNLALWYSPDEVQFYLVDFKKGVEFKTYALHDLPHARAVAVESDREFGLSVLQRVDNEMKQRGDLFRDLGVQDVAGYRALGRDEPLPRTLLVIDEFQEMFVEDDKLGQDAALLMDRLVRQGRAFGVHVLLGSQTLGGAYTLARSTMGQMQVRIALQCSEADSYLIMSDDNAAARLLSRPGEAIYNDAGGAIEGNSPFQIVWLPDAERERQLKRAQALAEKHAYRRSDPLIVFEGNASADVAGNHLLEAAIAAPAWPDSSSTPPPPPPQAWLGEAIAIKGPTSSLFRRQSGSNLLMVGQRDEAALAMTASSIISLAAQRAPGAPDETGNDPAAPLDISADDGDDSAAATGAPPDPPRPSDAASSGARFYILDGTPFDSPNAGFLETVAKRLPHAARLVPWRDVEPAIAEIAAELERRQSADATDAAPIFLFIYALQRFRMLRTTDDFGFSMGTEDASPAPERQFAEILREGAPLGIHTIAWCDTATNLNRTLDRNGLREFESRVLFQMSGADSTQLIDGPAASKLGLRRALFYNEEEGVLEKFRPYAMPDAAWLESVRERLAQKAAAAAKRGATDLVGGE